MAFPAAFYFLIQGLCLQNQADDFLQFLQTQAWHWPIIKNIRGRNLFDYPKRASFTQFDLQFTVWVLISWPPLSYLLPHESSPHIIRICALLARRPSAGQLIPMMLQIPPETTYPLLDFLYMEGYICSIGEIQKQEQAPLPKTDPEVPAETSSFLGKVWQQLLDKYRP